jgi:hypothetical protein
MGDHALLRRIAGMAEAMTNGSGGMFDLVVGIPQSDAYEWRNAAPLLRSVSSSVEPRRLVWHDLRVEIARRIFQLQERPVAPPAIDMVSFPRDWGWNYTDCTHWIIVPDHTLGPVINIRPTMIYCRDMSARYVPQLIGASMHDPSWKRLEAAYRSWRRADLVVTTDPQTSSDVAGFAGISPRHIAEVPLTWAHKTPQRAGSDNTAMPRRGVLWLTGNSPVHDLDRALVELSYFLRQRPKTPVLIASEIAQVLRRKDIMDRATALDLELDHPRYEGLDFLVLRDDVDLYEAIENMSVIWSSARAVGEPETPWLAAKFGRCFVGTDYPQQRRAVENYFSRAFLYDPEDPRAAANALDRALSTPMAEPDEATALPSSPCTATAYADVFRQFLRIP